MSEEKRRNIAIVLLVINLVIIKFFMGGAHFENFFSELIPQVITLIIISLVVMIVPIILRIKNKKRFEYNKGYKICLINSIVIFVISCIPCLYTLITSSGNYEMMSVNPVDVALGLIIIFFIFSIDYFYINMLLFVNSKSKK